MISATLNVTLPFLGLFPRKKEVVKPVWEHPTPAQPIRHPARPRMAYRPRGIYRADLAEAWGFTRHQALAQENELKRFARFDAEFEAARRAVARRWLAACAAGIPAGFGVLYVGYGLVSAELPEPANASAMVPEQSSAEIIPFVPNASSQAPTLPRPQSSSIAVIQPRSISRDETERNGLTQENAKLSPVEMANDLPSVVATSTESGLNTIGTAVTLAPAPVMVEQPAIVIAEVSSPAQPVQASGGLDMPSATGAAVVTIASVQSTLFETFATAPLAPRGLQQGTTFTALPRALHDLNAQMARGSSSAAAAPLSIPSDAIPTRPSVSSQTLVFELQTTGPATPIAPLPTTEIILAAMPDATWNVAAAPMLGVAEPEPNPFFCHACAPMAPSLDGIGIALFETTALAGNDLNDLQERLLEMGASQVQRTETGIAVARSQVRFYRAQDATTAALLAATLGAVAVDVSWAAPQADAASFDLLIAAQDDNPHKN